MLGKPLRMRPLYEQDNNYFETANTAQKIMTATTVNHSVDCMLQFVLSEQELND